MKRNGILIFFFVLCSYKIWAQHNVLSVGSAKTLTILSGTLFSADSLVLTPGINFTMSSNAILETPVPVPGVPTGSIKRVYYLNSPITFTGTIQIYYQLSELNGNTESLLKYNDSTTGSWWLVAASSFDNTVSHFVQFAASGKTLIAATAAGAGTALPLKLIFFAGNWDRDHVKLEWIVDQNEGSKSFTVESSLNGQNWQALDVVPGTTAAGQYTYNYNDQDAQFSTKLYRIKIAEISGKISYSPIIKVNKSGSTNNIRVIGKSNGMTIYFTGDQPKGVRVLNASGQTIWRDNTSRNKYELNSLLPGIYFIQYELNGQVNVKQFPLQ